VIPEGFLTPRQLEICKLVAQGLQNKQIAEVIGLTPNTVKVYVHRIYDKTGMGNRLELALWYTAKTEGTHHAR